LIEDVLPSEAGLVYQLPYWVAEGTHLNVVGSNFLGKAELDAVAVRRCESIVVDSKDQARLEGQVACSLRLVWACAGAEKAATAASATAERTKCRMTILLLDWGFPRAKAGYTLVFTRSTERRATKRGAARPLSGG
jgi:hypothetical protein